MLLGVLDRERGNTGTCSIDYNNYTLNDLYALLLKQHLELHKLGLFTTYI